MRISDWSSDVCSSDLFGDADAIEAERAGLESISGARAIYSNADLTKVDAIEAMMTKAGERFGGVDILINNAGMQHVAPVEEFPVGRWVLIIARNLNAAFKDRKSVVSGKCV